MSTELLDKNQQEMLKQAEESAKYSWLEKYLKDIKEQLGKSPTTESLELAKKWVKALKAKFEELKQKKSDTCDNTKDELANLKEEFELSQEIQDKIEEIEIIKEIKAQNNSLDLTDVNIKSALKCLMTPNFKWWNSRAWFDVKYKPSWYGINMWFTELKNLNALQSAYNDNNWTKTAINLIIQKYNLWAVKTETTNNAWATSEKVVTGNKKEKVTWTKTDFQDTKKSWKIKMTEDWVNTFDNTNNIQEWLQLPKKEIEAIEQIIWVKLDKVNYKSLFDIKERLKVVHIDSKDWLKQLWYKPTWFGIMISDDELAQIKSLQDALRDANKNILVNWILYYYENWNTALDYAKDKQIAEKVKQDNVYDALSYKDIGAIKWIQLKEIFKKSKNETKTIQAISKLINVWKNEDISKISSKNDLLELIKKDPSVLLSFRKGAERIWYASVDLWRYIDNWWDISEDLKSLEEWSKRLNIALDKEFEKKFPEAISKAKENINKSTTLSPEEKQKQLAVLDDLQTKNKQWFKDFFKIKSLGFLASLVETKKWGWWSLIIWNNSENAIVSKIDIEIWMFATADNKYYPCVGLAIWDEHDFTDTVKWHARAWVNIFWVYLLAWIDKQINAEELKNAEFRDFEWKTKRVWVYWNAWFGWTWWFTYWTWLYYKESKKEGIEKKAKQLDDIIDQFKNIQKISDINSVDLWNINEWDQKLIKFEIKRLLEGLWFDNEWNTQERKTQIIELVRQSKKNEFYQVASAKAEDSWWNWSGAALWVQFIWGFFPIPVIWISFAKVNQEQKHNTHKQKMDALIRLGKNSESKDYNKVIEDIKSTLDIDIIFDKEKWVFVVSWYDDEKWMIINKSWQWVKIKYNKESSKNIKIDWEKLIFWNVWLVRALSNIKNEWILMELRLWWWEEEIKPWNSKDFTSTISEWLNTTISVKTEEKLWKVNIEKLNKSYSDFIEKNKNTITKWLSVYKSKKWNAYIDIRKWLDSGNLEQARKWLINYLVAHNQKDSKWAVDYIKSLKNESELASTIADFKDILMSDQSTIMVSWVSQEEKNRMTEEFKKNPSKYRNVNTYDLLTKDFNWDKTLNRKAAFTKMANKNLWSNSANVLAMREKAANECRGEAWWTSENRNNIFALVGSYKIAKDNEWKTHSAWTWFDAMPPWVVSVANGRTYEFTPSNKKELIENFASKKVYFENMKNSILASLNAKMPEWHKINKDLFTREKFIQVLETWNTEIDWKKVNIESKFVFFLYWRCFNESIWIEFWNIKVEQEWKQTVSSPIDFASQKTVDQTIIRPDETIISVWAWWWNKKNDTNDNSTNNNTTTPGATQTNWQSWVWAWNWNVI